MSKYEFVHVNNGTSRLQLTKESKGIIHVVNLYRNRPGSYGGEESDVIYFLIHYDELKNRRDKALLLQTLPRIRKKLCLAEDESFSFILRSILDSCNRYFRLENGWSLGDNIPEGILSDRAGLEKMLSEELRELRGLSIRAEPRVTYP